VDKGGNMNNNDVWEISKWFKRFSNRHEVIIKNWEERKEEIKETLVREKGEELSSNVVYGGHDQAAAFCC